MVDIDIIDWLGETGRKPAPVKSIRHKFPTEADFDEFYTVSHRSLNFLDNKSEEDILASYKYLYWLWQRWGYRRYNGHPADFFNKFFSRFASTFYELRQREKLYKNIYKDLKLQIGELLELSTKEWHRTSADEKGDDKDSLEEQVNRHNKAYERTHEESKHGTTTGTKERPYETLDLIGQHYGNIVQDEYFGRADWLGGETIEKGGYIEIERYPKGHEKYGEIIYDKDGNPSRALNPNWVKNYINRENWDDLDKNKTGRSDYRKDRKEELEKTIDRQEQPMINSQVARILMAYKNYETYPTDLIESFRDLFTDWFVGGGKYEFNPQNWDYDFVPSDTVRKIEAGKKKEQKAPREKPAIDPNKDLSLNEWEELWAEKTKPCMPSWYLEQLYRYRRKTSEKPDKEDADHARLEILETLIEAFYRPPYIPKLSIFEVQMGTPDVLYCDKDEMWIDPDDLSDEQKTSWPEAQKRDKWSHFVVNADNEKAAIKEKKDKTLKFGQVVKCGVEGFADFKEKLYQELKVALRRQENKVPFFQVFPVMVGPPGTGKSEISNRLAKAYEAPLQAINCAGMDDSGEFEGKRATLQNANYGKMLGGFVDKSILVDVTIEDLEKDIKLTTTYRDEKGVEQKRPPENIRDWERDRADKLKDEIDEWNAENDERVKEGKPKREFKKKPYRSMSTIFLFDEFEKISDQGALDTVGKITDREQNWNFIDRYFNFRVDLSRCWILMTANYPEKVPQFIQDRALQVKIELLTWKQRLSILRDRIKKEMKVYKIAHLTHKVLGGTPDEPGGEDRFLEMLIPETWGVRGGINNIAATIAFLESMVVDDEDKKVPGPKKPTQYLGNLWEPDKIEETPENEYHNSRNGVLRLIWHNLGGKERVLSLTKRLGVETRTSEDLTTGEVKKTLEVVTGVDEKGKVFVADWGGPRKKWIKSDGSAGLETDEGVRDYQWWYGYTSAAHPTPDTSVGYIIHQAAPGATPGKPGEKPKERPFASDYHFDAFFTIHKEVDGEDIYLLDGIANDLDFLGQKLTVQRIKLIASQGNRTPDVYKTIIQDALTMLDHRPGRKRWELRITNNQKAVWNAAKNQITIYCKWDIWREGNRVGPYPF